MTREKTHFYYVGVFDCWDIRVDFLLGSSSLVSVLLALWT
mgnify:CR=1 FL=1